MDAGQAQRIAGDITQRYRERTKQSAIHDQAARKHLPGGDTRTATYYSPYPAYVERGEGAYIFDCDGNRYIDFLNNYTSLIHGHRDPDILAAAKAQLEKGTMFGSPAALQYEHAGTLCRRLPSMDLVRYCNSGTEATLFCMRAARAFTGKEMILKMDGGYHGSHDCAEVNVTPDLKTTGLPRARLEVKGVPAQVLENVLVAPFNDLGSAETLLKNYGDKIAAVILEPMLGALGMVPPRPGFLQGMRQLADRYHVLLIFDEIITFRLSAGGFQVLSGVPADLTSLGKIIGGGFPVGAFGGRKEILQMFAPGPGGMTHSGTFNGNNMTMAAGLAALKKYDEDAIAKVNRLGDRLRKGINGAFKAVGIKGQATGLHSLAQVHWREGNIENARDTVLGLLQAGELPRLFHLEMMNRGTFLASRGMMNVSTPMSEKEIDTAVGQVEETLRVLKPYAEIMAPALVV